MEQGSEGGRSGSTDAGGLPRELELELERVFAWEQTLEQRLDQAEVMAGQTLPTYSQLYDIAALIIGPSLGHARADNRELLERAARRYDRYSLRLHDVGAPGAPLSKPTALSWLAAEASIEWLSPVGSVAAYAKSLDRASKELRASWDEQPEADAIGAAVRRLQRRVRRRADDLGKRPLRFQFRQAPTAHAAPAEEPNLGQQQPQPRGWASLPLSVRRENLRQRWEQMLIDAEIQRRQRRESC